VAEVATGFTLILRRTFERFELHCPELRYRSDDPTVPEGQRDRTLYFGFGIDPKTRRYLSEDYAFCQRVRGAGCRWRER
jgi:hypothetical protein